MRKNDVSTFESKTIPEPNTGCLLWTANLSKSGYGKVSVENITMRAHRWAWELFNGHIPDGMLVCHKCDTRACVNINHLFIGTQLDNRIDCKAKGRVATGDKSGLRLHPERAARGDRNGARIYRDRVSAGIRKWFNDNPGVIRKNGMAKLSEAEAKEIIGYLKRDNSVKNKKILASEFGVSYQMIYVIEKGRAWKHLVNKDNNEQQ